MSTGQLLLTFFVALLVFGPDKLPLLARHLGQLMNQLHRAKRHIAHAWETQLNEQKLQENCKKAREADVTYQADK